MSKPIHSTIQEHSMDRPTITLGQHADYDAIRGYLISRLEEITHLTEVGVITGTFAAAQAFEADYITALDDAKAVYERTQSWDAYYQEHFDSATQILGWVDEGKYEAYFIYGPTKPGGSRSGGYGR